MGDKQVEVRYTEVIHPLHARIWRESEKKGGKRASFEEGKKEEEEEGDVRWDTMRSGHDHIIKHVKAAGRRGALGKKKRLSGSRK